MNAGRIKLLVDKMAMEYAQMGIPTGDDLYNSIAQSNYWKTRGRLHDAIDDLEGRIMDAFFEGYSSRSTYNDIQESDPYEEWIKYYNKELNEL